MAVFAHLRGLRSTTKSGRSSLGAAGLSWRIHGNWAGSLISLHDAANASVCVHAEEAASAAEHFALPLDAVRIKEQLERKGRSK